MPIYPFVIYLAMLWLPKFEDKKWIKWAAGFAPAVFVLLLPAAVVADVCDLIPIEYKSLTWGYVALGTLFAASCVALWQLWRGEIQRSIVWCGGGLLAMIALATPAIPQFNSQLGVGDLAAEATEVAQAEGIEHYAFYRFRSGQNMDIYLNQPCEPIYDVEQLDSLDCLPHRSVLFIGWKEPQRDSLFAKWLEGRKQTIVGNRSFTVVGRERPRIKLRKEAQHIKLQVDSTKLQMIQ